MRNRVPSTHWARSARTAAASSGSRSCQAIIGGPLGEAAVSAVTSAASWSTLSLSPAICPRWARSTANRARVSPSDAVPSGVAGSGCLIGGGLQLGDELGDRGRQDGRSLREPADTVGGAAPGGAELDDHRGLVGEKDQGAGAGQ